MKIDKKQKVVLVLTICAFAFLGWQIYDLFFAGPETIAVAPVVKKWAKTQAKASTKAPIKKSSAPKMTKKVAKADDN